MRRLLFGFGQIVILAGLCLAVAAAEEPTRSAIVVDATGVTTEVIVEYGDFLVRTKNFDVTILLNKVISIQTQGQTATVRYLCWGKETAITGELRDREWFSGKSDFGDFRIKPDKLRQLTFKTPPVKAKGEEVPAYDSVLVFADGQTMEAAEVEAAGPAAARFRGFGIVLRTKSFDVLIPLEKVISIQIQGQTAEVRYVWWGKETAITGQMPEQRIAGKGDFGAFGVDTSAGRLRRVTFTTPRALAEKGEVPAYDAVLVLMDGTRLPVADLRKVDHYHYTYSDGYFTRGGWSYGSRENFEFLRGESEATVRLTDLKTLQFRPGKKVTVTLKNGNSSTGQYSDEGSSGVIGFSGTCEKGDLFIDVKDIRAIEFGPPQE